LRENIDEFDKSLENIIEIEKVKWKRSNFKAS
jgi:hypothetical protein